MIFEQAIHSESIEEFRRIEGDFKQHVFYSMDERVWKKTEKTFTPMKKYTFDALRVKVDDVVWCIRHELHDIHFVDLEHD